MGRLAALTLLVLLAWGGPSAATAAPETSDAPVNAPAAAPLIGWQWPLDSFRLVLPYEAPAHRYGPGHRGVDLLPAGTDELRAPATGVVAFSGTVVDRAVMTIDHGNGLVTTLEPVRDAPVAGTFVAAGDPVGHIGAGGHAPPGTVHFGVRREGEYINPMLLFEAVPRAVLLPCC
ncbi:hypothetical protein GCM10022382_09370 [Microbacterium invictum]